MVPLRLLSVDARTLPLDRHALAGLIAAADVDVACVQGVPIGLRWRSKCAALGRESGLVVVSGGRTGGGTLLLSTLGVDVEAARDHRFTGGHGPAPAGASLAVLSRLGSRFALAGARLSGEPRQRTLQVTELSSARRDLVPDDPPALLCVAGVDRPGSASWELLADGRKVIGTGIFVDPAFSVDDVDQVGPGTDPDRPTRVTLHLT